MPELPEVEHAARCLRRWLLGRRIVRAVAAPTRVLRGAPPARFARALSGRSLVAVERRGKNLLLDFDAGVGLYAHLGMTGKLVRRPRSVPTLASRARFELDDGWTVHFRDPRLFGRLTVVVPAAALRQLPEIASLGPDAERDLRTPGELAKRLAGTRRPVKVALMDQRVLAGLGNIHAAEALFRAGINPRRRCDRLKPREIEALFDAIHQTIGYALSTLPDPDAQDVGYVEEGAQNPFLVYGRKGEPCPRCGRKLRSFVQGGRSTYWCAGCQK